ncbi:MULTISPECIES: hypothetical protein [unclassified Lysobacter]|uniref:hypothetical protein n=1 Tax=unclassified Lysobacter TaxID=2635362 RepID=UPI001BECDC68|nr:MULTISPECIES: hypothetical protein [unclassified Lysobacter]MBT2747480.1 hypothetical protein [Lysobacter sp. ISL-42]MBT2752726.1 hypothetical protein [Lysobacter sp. ISL-50]MBT2778383.1 hypothetical protein [Lysobacter sp. ISL-54]MBT2783901.1 hypothetical protein [Lysobacter sp. ISL-52]
MRFESHRTHHSGFVVSSGAIGAGRFSRPLDSILSPDAVDLDAELSHWRRHHRGLLIDRTGLRFGDYEPALKLGLDAYMRGHGRSFSDMEEELRGCYRRVRGVSRLDWDEARIVVAAACERLRLHRRAQ